MKLDSVIATKSIRIVVVFVVLAICFLSSLASSSHWSKHQKSNNDQQLAAAAAAAAAISSYSSSSSASTQKVKVLDSPNLRLEFCDDCHLFLGGLFPVHAPKYARQTVVTVVPNDVATQKSTQASNIIDLEHLVAPMIAQTQHHNQQHPPVQQQTTTTTKAKQPPLVVPPEEDNIASMSCGEIKKERGIQRLEAMLFAIDLVNNSTSLLPHLKLGARIFDTCDRDTIALEKCVSFVSDYFLLNDDSISNDFGCTLNETVYGSNLVAPSMMRAYKKKDVINRRKVIGVIGAASSSVSIQVANLLRLFQVPQISYASTSPELSNKERFPYFSRVLPSDTLQAEAIANLVSVLDWNYISTLNEEGNLGGIDAFNVYARARKICIADSYTLSQTASEDDVKAILTEMYNQKNARGVVMFLQDHNIRKLLRLVKNLNMTGHFLWVASDSWGTKKESIDSNDEVAEGAITFSPKSYEIKEFNEYFKKLKPSTNTRNPWFREFWEEQFNCTLDKHVTYTTNHRRSSSRRLCTGEEQLNITQDSFIHFVIDSVYAMAHAIENLIKQQCTKHQHNVAVAHNAAASTANFLRCLNSVEMRGADLLKEIRRVEFDSITGRRVRFVEGGDGLAPYEVFQYQLLDPDTNKYGYKKITEWEKDKPFKLDRSKLKWPSQMMEERKTTTTSSSSEEEESSRRPPLFHPSQEKQEFPVPRSVCKEECEQGEIKQGDDCCWVCVKCEENEYVASDRKHCIKCQNGYGPNDQKTACQKLPIEYMSFNSPFTIITVIFATVGALFTCYTIFVFIRYSNTPIIKASGRELCYVLLAGIMSCYLITFPLVTKPTPFSCFTLRFGVSLSLTIMLSALFTKTNRLSRIFNSSVKQVRQAAYVSPQSQLVICFSMIAIQVIGILIWTVISFPDTSFDYDDPKRVILQCKTQNTHLAASFSYNMFLVILCTIYAVKTRKIPENFNEARFIGFTMYSICIIWAAFFAIYFGTTAAAGTSKTPKNNYKIQLTTLAMSLSLSATVVLFCLFLPKLRVVLLKPDKNVRSKSSNIVKSVYKSHQQKGEQRSGTAVGGNDRKDTSSSVVGGGKEAASHAGPGVSTGTLSARGSASHSHANPHGGGGPQNSHSHNQLSSASAANATHYPHHHSVVSTTTMAPPTITLTTTEKSVTLATAVSTSSMASSPPSHPSTPISSGPFTPTSKAQSTTTTTTLVNHNNKEDEITPLPSKEVEEKKETKAATTTNSSGNNSDTTNVVSTAIDSLHDLSYKIFAVEKNLSLIPADDRVSESSMDTLLVKKEKENASVTPPSVKENFTEGWLKGAAAKKAQPEDTNHLLLDDDKSGDQAKNGENYDAYQYYILESRTTPGQQKNKANVVKMSTSTIEFKCSSSSSPSRSSQKATATPSPHKPDRATNKTINGPIITNTKRPSVSQTQTQTQTQTPPRNTPETRQQLSNATNSPTISLPTATTTSTATTIANEEDVFDESTIRSVVEKCFNQISKNKKITSPLLYLQQQQPELKLIKVKPFEDHNHQRHHHHNKHRHRSDKKDESPNETTMNTFEDDHQNQVENQQQQYEDINSSSSMSSICLSSAATTASSSVDANNNHVNHTSIKQSVVEKCGELLKQASPITNTVLLAGAGNVLTANKPNENPSSDDPLYSLKITFV